MSQRRQSHTRTPGGFSHVPLFLRTAPAEFSRDERLLRSLWMRVILFALHERETRDAQAFFHGDRSESTLADICDHLDIDLERLRSIARGGLVSA